MMKDGPQTFYLGYQEIRKKNKEEKHTVVCNIAEFQQQTEEEPQKTEHTGYIKEIPLYINELRKATATCISVYLYIKYKMT